MTVVYIGLALLIPFTAVVIAELRASDFMACAASPALRYAIGRTRAGTEPRAGSIDVHAFNLWENFGG